MRRLSTFAFSTIALFTLGGCGLILGSFTTEGGGNGDAGKETSVNDGSNDGPAVDGNPDAEPPPKLLNCSLDGVSHKVLNDPSVSPERVFVHVTGGNNNHRVGYVNITNNRRRVNFIDMRQDATNQVPIAAPSFTPASDHIAAAAYDGGFVVVGFDSGTGILYASSLPDGANAMLAAVTVATQPAMPLGASIGGFALAPVDPVNGIFFMALAVGSTQNGPYSLYAGTINVNSPAQPPPLQVVRTFNGKVEIDSGATMVDRVGRKATMIIGTQGQAIDSQIFSVDFSQNVPTISPITNLLTTGQAHVISAFTAASVPAPGVNGAAFLEGDLSNQTIPFGYRVSMVPDNKTPGLGSADMGPLVKFDSLDDLAADKAQNEWRFFAGGAQLLITGRRTGTGDGINMLWFDNTGNLRAKASGTAALVTNEKVQSAWGTFRQPPVAVLAGMSVSWINVANDVMIADVTCRL